MRPFFPVLYFLVLGWPSAAPATPARMVVISPCVMTRPAPPAEPPAWLLLAGAVLVLGAGRLAAR